MPGWVFLTTSSLCFLNLTNFKMYNAVHGWKEGNRLIAYLGASIRREFPQALVCHVGGDQFSLLARKATVLEQIKTSA